MTAALIAKLESASEGSRELDAEIIRLFGGQAVARFGDWDCREDGTGIWLPLPRYSSSVDAALALAERVLPGWFWSVRKNVTTGHLATLFALNEPPWTGSAYEKMEQGTANTPALAICAALLRASAVEGAGE